MMNTTLTNATINAASYKELQAMAKANGISAKQKADALRAALIALVPQETEGDLTSEVTGQAIDKVCMPIYLMDVNPETFVVGKKAGMLIAERIVKGGKDRNGKSHSAAMFKATKSKDASSNGKWMVTMSKLYAIIADVYGIPNDEATREKSDAFIKNGVINYLCKNGWLTFKRYESGALSFFPTQKMAALFSK